MCDDCNTKQAEQAASGIYGNAGSQLKQTPEPRFRHRLEEKRNRLTKQLVQVEAALQLVYTNPDAEKIYEVLNRV